MIRLRRKRRKIILLNYTKILNYLKKKTTLTKVVLNLIYQYYQIKGQTLKIDSGTFCIYTYRNRSIFNNYKMSRHKLKMFLDYRSISNIYVK
jgi:hypothetical protein